MARWLVPSGVRLGLGHGLDCKSMFLQNGTWAGLALLRGVCGGGGFVIKKNIVNMKYCYFVLVLDRLDGK